MSYKKQSSVLLDQPSFILWDDQTVVVAVARHSSDWILLDVESLERVPEVVREETPGAPHKIETSSNPQIYFLAFDAPQSR